jgi:hypothetical protein
MMSGWTIHWDLLIICFGEWTVCSGYEYFSDWIVAIVAVSQKLWMYVSVFSVVLNLCWITGYLSGPVVSCWIKIFALYLYSDGGKDRSWLISVYEYNFVTEARKITGNLNQARRRPVPRMKPVISRTATQALQLEWISLTAEFNNLCN